MGTLHRLAERALNALPDTNCKTCLQVRSSIEGWVLAAETALSKKLGLAVGDNISKEHGNHMMCMEVEPLTIAETKDFMQRLGLSTADLAANFGLAEDKVSAFLEGRRFSPWEDGPAVRSELKAA